MQLTCLLKIILIINAVFCQETDLKNAMIKYGVIPDLLDEGPKDVLKVTFGNGAIVCMGDELTPTQVQNQPIVEWSAENATFYTLLFTEVDAPSLEDTSLKEWRHWLIVNIPGNNVDSGELLNGYQGSGPSKDSGFHRYVYLLFKQPDKLVFEENYVPADSIEGRPNFSTKNFSKKYGLGVPVAGNFYVAQYDEFSDVLLARLGFSL